MRHWPARIACLLTLAAASGARAEVRGRVMVDDGLPPAAAIQVELHCDGTETMTVAADAQGRFALGADASGDCRIRAVLPGYSPDSVAVKHLPLHPDIAGLALRRDGKWQGYGLSPTTLAVSEGALASFGNGVQALRAGGQINMANAERLFGRAAEEDPSFAEAWFQLARLRLARGDAMAARQALSASLAADPWLISPYQPLLMLELAEERWSAARALTQEWLRLAPNAMEPRFYSALASLELDDLQAARSDLQAIESRPEVASFALVHYLRGRMFERDGRQVEALSEYRSYLAAEPDGAMAAETRERLREGGAP